MAEKQQSGEEYPVTEKATRSVPPKERAFLEGLVGEALNESTPEGELEATKDGYPQLVAFAKHRVIIIKQMCRFATYPGPRAAQYITPHCTKFCIRNRICNRTCLPTAAIARRRTCTTGMVKLF